MFNVFVCTENRTLQKVLRISYVYVLVHNVYNIDFRSFNLETNINSDVFVFVACFNNFGYGAKCMVFSFCDRYR